MMVTPVLLLSLRVITLADAEKAAEAHQPSILQAEAQTDVARARADQAIAPLLPSLNATASYVRSTNNRAPTPGVIIPGGTAINNSFDPAATIDSFRLNLQGTQLLWDFGLSRDRYRASKASVDSQVSTELATRLQALQTVRQGYFTAVANKALVNVQRESVTNLARHLQQIEGFVRVGNRPEIDLAQARTDLANGQVALITAENNYDLARAQLNQAMGVTDGTDYDVADDTLPVAAGEDAATEVLVEEALKARPDWAALEAGIRAQELLLSSAKGGYWPSFSAILGFTGSGSKLDELGYNLSAGLQGAWGFQGGLAIAQVHEQRAQLAFNRAQLLALRIQVRLDVDQARFALRAAKAQVVAAEEARKNAKERLRLAEGRYSSGVGNSIELGDAQVAYTTAAAQKVQFENNVGIARAQLLRAVGRR